MASTKDKVRISIYSAIIFFVIASPFMYTVTGAVFGRAVATAGHPTFLGLLLHTIVYGLVAFGSMFIPNL
jgi:hypothetical protein